MTKIILAHELLEEGINKIHKAKHLDVSRRTIIRWSQAIDRHGSLEAFLEYYQKAKKGDRQKRKIDPILKRRIWSLRKKHHQCCGQKIQYFLQKEYGTQVSVTKIYKVLSENINYAQSGRRTRKGVLYPMHELPERCYRWIQCFLEKFLPSLQLISTLEKAMSSYGPHWKPLMAKLFWIIVCQGALIVFQISFRLMVEVSSKENSAQV